MNKHVIAVINCMLFGAVAALAQSQLDPSHFDWKHTGTVAFIGAVTAIYNNYKTSPVDSNIVEEDKVKKENGLK